MQLGVINKVATYFISIRLFPASLVVTPLLSRLHAHRSIGRAGSLGRLPLCVDYVLCACAALSMSEERLACGFGTLNVAVFQNADYGTLHLKNYNISL